MPRPTQRSCLECLTKKRLLQLDREFEIGTPQLERKAVFVEALASSKRASFANLLEELLLTELRHICRAHELPSSGNKDAVIARLRNEDREGARPRVKARAAKTDEPVQGSLLPPADGDDEVAADVAAFFARSQPSVRGIVPDPAAAGAGGSAASAAQAA